MNGEYGSKRSEVIRQRRGWVYEFKTSLSVLNNGTEDENTIRRIRRFE